ncbi:VRR-NUC domain-containing protein [Massilia sp. TS11]|uniref:VRR-NUC domain-containing protein n=1 Tax=Massilia sp. TS11 TaxID=2908003 RepID=UPI001EDC784A|nr:VRR-NUC domain-containing protein [Massilia sp. TS11]MCG2584210.1 VRR-NUC domain-containing protein [Massilia sp. TS11]
MQATIDNPFYYLDNFHQVLDWIGARYADLLTPEESDFLVCFRALPQPAQALFVRMVMRKGEHFRASKLSYAEIGNTLDAARPLIGAGLLEQDPAIDLDTLFQLLGKPEIISIFGLNGHERQARKADQLEALRSQYPDARRFSDWCRGSSDTVLRICVQALCDRLRLIFFGNAYQDWSEFVLSDLGIFKYERVEFSPASRGFRNRDDIDAYLAIQALKDRFFAGEDPADLLGQVPPPHPENEWLRSRREKLVFQIGQQLEKLQQWQAAYAAYAQTRYPGARARAVRVLEKDAQYGAAHRLLESALAAPESETEIQHLQRIAPRLQRKLGLQKSAKANARDADTLELCLPQPEDFWCVEETVRLHLHSDEAPAFYVENALINGLFGLLCWPAIFSAIPGAFFHPFHRGPVDLHSGDFHGRRAHLFEACFQQLDDGRYRDTILATFRDKHGTQSPFLIWDALNEALIDMALDCIPVEHLRKWFERMLFDLKANRTGFPDLIQFWPSEKRYRMVEVKGPGDRLQDNQLRWIAYCAEHAMPVTVCYLQWQNPT